MRLVAMLVALLLQLSSAIARPTQVYMISIPTSSTKDRLMGFNITVKAGRVAELLDCPPGWTITLENDPSWQATIEGHAIVGAASISIKQLPTLFLLAPVPNNVADVVTGPISATVKLTTMRNGELITFDEPHIKVVLPQENPR